MVRLSIFLSAVLLLISSCKYDAKQWSRPNEIVATTGMVGEIANKILPANKFSVHTLMGPGVDPHLYEAKPSDIRFLGEAEVILYSGLHLEGKLAKLFPKLKKEKTVLAVADGLAESELIAVTDDLHDPHIWLDPILWSQGVGYIGRQLAKRYPAYSSEILTNTKAYQNEILATASWMERQLQNIPKAQRVLITSHDAFQYFGRRFQVQVEAIQGVSTVSEPGIQTIGKLVNIILQQKVNAVFVESSVSSKSITALIESVQRNQHQVKRGAVLYSDAFGGKGSGADTYIGMLRTNTQHIFEGLKDE